MKKCSKCQTVYNVPSDHFQKKAQAKDGLQSWCKGCVKSAHRKNYKRNRKSIIAKQMERNKRYSTMNKAARQALLFRVEELEKKLNECLERLVELESKNENQVS